MRQLVIRSLKDPEYRHVVSARETDKQMERTEDGVLINLNHAEFYTAFEDEPA